MLLINQKMEELQFLNEEKINQEVARFAQKLGRFEFDRILMAIYVAHLNDELEQVQIRTIRSVLNGFVAEGSLIVDGEEFIFVRPPAAKVVLLPGELLLADVRDQIELKINQAVKSGLSPFLIQKYPSEILEQIIGFSGIKLENPIS